MSGRVLGVLLLALGVYVVTRGTVRQAGTPITPEVAAQSEWAQGDPPLRPAQVDPSVQSVSENRVEVLEDANASDACTLTVKVGHQLVGTCILSLAEVGQASSTGHRTDALPIERVVQEYHLTAGVAVLSIPRGRYHSIVRVGDRPLSVELLDARGATATLRVELPDLVRWSGSVSGSLRGPLAGLWLEARSDDGGFREFVSTDASGRFEFELPARESIELRPGSIGGSPFFDLRIRPELQPPMTTARPTQAYVVKEALLRLAESPPSPLMDGFALTLRRTEAGRRNPAPRASVDLDASRSAEVHLPPGSYVLERKSKAESVQSVEFTLEPDEQRDLVLDCSSAAVLALDVFPSVPERRSLRIRLREPNGHVVDFAVVRSIEGLSHAYRELVPAGPYDVEVASYRRGARASDEPLDVWRGDVNAVVGAGVPLRVFVQ